MDLTQAKREFQIRCCYWSHSELKREIVNSFPNLRLFRSGYGWKLHHFMQKLELGNQLTLAQAMVKRSSVYLEVSGEIMTEEEKKLLELFEQFTLEPSSLELEIQTRKQSGEKIKLASKRQLRKAAVSRFIEAFESQCFEMKTGEEWDPLFRMRFCGWIVSTQLIFGRSAGLLQYRHIIESEKRITHPQNPQITGPAMTLSAGVAWLVSQWENIMDDDVNGVCDALIKQVGFFLEVAPKLLKGLEYQQIGNS